MTSSVPGIAGTDMDRVTVAMSVLLLHIPVSAHMGCVTLHQPMVYTVWTPRHYLEACGAEHPGSRTH